MLKVAQVGAVGESYLEKRGISKKAEKISHFCVDDTVERVA